MNDPFIRHLQAQLSELMQSNLVITENSQVYGGDINLTYVIAAAGSRYFIKCNSEAASTGMFEKEYNGLQLLKQKSLLRIPRPFLCGQFDGTSYLVMECLHKTDFTPATWKALGEGIAGMHRQTQLQFGLEEDNYIGSLPQTNRPADSWAGFYKNQRVMPLIAKAFDSALCTKEDVKDAEAICNKLSAFFPEEPPALLHGDLWSGNVMACDDKEVAIYDPAVYYGHREIDIAMTLLFGGFDSSFYQSYQEAAPLQSGWQQRVALCQLYPLLVHLILFGSGYYSRVKNVLNQYK